MSNSAIVADQNVLNAQIFFQQLDRLMGASIGVIAVRTREMDRAKTLLHEWSSMRGMDFHVWTRLMGFQKYRQIPTTMEEGDAPAIAVDSEAMGDFLKPDDTLQGTDGLFDALEHFDKRYKAGDTGRNKFVGVFMALDQTELSDMPHVHQYIRDHVQRAYEIDDRMILLLPLGTEIPPTLVGDVELIELDPPSFAELKDAFADTEESIQDALGFVPDDNGINSIVQNGLGMTHQEFENAISLAIVDLADKKRLDEDLVLTADDFIDVVRKRKLEILKQTQILELMPTIDISKVGGLDLLKKDLLRTAAAFTPEARAFGVTMPKGYIVIGPPGTGKTLICKVTSSVLGMPGIRFDISAVYQGLVGSSEANMRMCLKMVEDMAPCILFVDEIEKAIASDGGNDGGVSSRILGTFLTWLNDRQDRNVPVYVIASANDVTRMPPELLRMGRFDKKWAITFPAKGEREQIIKIHVEQRGHKLTSIEYKRIAAQTETFVGAELEGIVEQALLEDFYQERDSLQFETLEKFALETKPQVKAFPERIKQMQEWAERNATPASSVASGEADEGTTATGSRPMVIRRPKRRGGAIKSGTN